MKFRWAIVTAVCLSIGAMSPVPAPASSDVQPTIPEDSPWRVKLDNAPSRGPANAPITIVEFSDFECPFSAQSSRNLRRLVEVYPTQVRWVSKQFPLKFHKKAPLAHEAALAAGAQGRFFEMAALIFKNQAKLDRADLDGYARELGLDMAKFSEDMNDRNLRPHVLTDILEARRVGVFATPTLFINGQVVMGAKTLPQLRAVVEHLLQNAGNGSAPTEPAAPAPNPATGK